MFKLPLLQPHLTGPNGIEGRAGSQNSSFQPFEPRQGCTLPLHFETKDWQTQAREVTAELSNGEKYKSLAIHAEVKFHEALERCLKVSPLGYNAGGEERPNKLRTAVCCQLLGEFADMCGPLSGVLRSLRDELIKSVYSTYCVSERGLMTFDQLPWFSVAERLEQEKVVFLAEQDKFKAMLIEQQTAILTIEEQLESYKEAMQTSQHEALSLKTRLEGLVVSEETSRLEAKTGREELKKVRKEIYKLKEELDIERAGHSDTAARLLKAEVAVKEGLAVLTVRLQEAEDAAQRAWHEAERRLPPEVIEDTKMHLDMVSKQLNDTNRKVRELELVRDKLGAKMESMTPRPTWRTLKKYGVEPRERTQDTLVAVSERLSAYQGEMDELAGYVALMYDVLAPDPAPREVQLSVTTDSSNYFITEGGESQGPAEPCTTADPLGTGPQVPRCLRSRERVDVQALSLPDTEVMVASIWKAKSEYDATHMAQSLQEFLYHFCAATASAAATVSNRDAVRPPGHPSSPHVPSTSATTTAGGAASGGGGTVTPTGPSDVRHVGATGVGTLVRSYHTHGEVVRRSYSLYYALENHSSSSPTLALFRSVLFGQLSEAVHWDQQAMVSGLCRAVERLAVVAPSAQLGALGASISLEHLTTLFERYFPQRPTFRVSRLADAVGDLVAASGVSPSADGDGTSGGSGGVAVPVNQLLSLLRPRGLLAASSPGLHGPVTSHGPSTPGHPPPSPLPPESAAGGGGGDGGEAAAAMVVDTEEEEMALVSLLLEQHLQEVTTLVEQVSTSLDEVPSSGGGVGGAGAAAARAVAGGKGGGGGAAATQPSWSAAPRGAPLEALVAILEEHVGRADVTSILGQAFGLPHSPAVDELRSASVVIPPAEFRRRVLARSILKPVGNFDVAGAMRWCDQLVAAAAAAGSGGGGGGGVASGGGLPDMS